MPKNELSKAESREVALSNREQIQGLQNLLVENADGVNIVTHQNSEIFPLEHTFADSIYIRQMTMNKDSLVVGAIHNHLHVWFLLSGHITVATEDESLEYLAPCHVLATPGTKRVIYANEDSVFVNVHKNPTNNQDIEELEREIVSATFEEYEEYINKK
jgi:quercetin dioxygenase-like cupin family protein|tara:strand:- start:290 stop:766 length:477 start_codon:yes stop_codon:yes gene_type:complete